ncbi:MAG: hypothetical protein GXX99_03925 [Clostridiales bacterium]|nr:hypothetical protein [Clostridiales bacterium]
MLFFVSLFFIELLLIVGVASIGAALMSFQRVLVVLVFSFCGFNLAVRHFYKKTGSASIYDAVVIAYALLFALVWTGIDYSGSLFCLPFSYFFVALMIKIFGKKT